MANHLDFASHPFGESFVTAFANVIRAQRVARASTAGTSSGGNSNPAPAGRGLFKDQTFIRLTWRPAFLMRLLKRMLLLARPPPTGAAFTICGCW